MEPQGVGQSGNFHWWEGVVEDNLDPKGAGRCKVRVIAHNTPIKLELGTVELPWAYPIMPLNNPHGKIVALKSGTRVFGFYRDGSLGQDLVMLGTMNIGYENPGKYDNYDEDIEPFLYNLLYNAHHLSTFTIFDNDYISGKFTVFNEKITRNRGLR